MDSTPPGSFTVREGDHLDILNCTYLPYRHIKVLGMGSSAFVEMVQDETNGQVIQGLRNLSNINEFKRGFRNEVNILRRLFPHISSLGIVLTPVADGGNLACYLQTILDLGNPPTTEQCIVLNQAFRCLASGPAIIHKQTIRHKDIKPQNILIHQGCVVYTDFGIALDTSQLDNTTTDGTAQAFTFRYCAPEVALSDKRNRKSDVFSLGCVFTEILSVLEPQIQLPQLGRTAYHKIIEDLQDPKIESVLRNLLES
ncbi:kinase-like domain-containing protein [Cenococcum geophilum]